jgi:hypothetical protein
MGPNQVNANPMDVPALILFSGGSASVISPALLYLLQDPLFLFSCGVTDITAPIHVQLCGLQAADVL